MPITSAVADVVATHWCELLTVTEVSDGDEFFELGGNSMLALMLVERVQTELHIEFPLEVMFMEGTFGAIVLACSERFVP